MLGLTSPSINQEKSSGLQNGSTARVSNTVTCASSRGDNCTQLKRGTHVADIVLSCAKFTTNLCAGGPLCKPIKTYREIQIKKSSITDTVLFSAQTAGPPTCPGPSVATRDRVCPASTSPTSQHFGGINTI